jgi:predicted DNA-binding protein
MQEKACLENRKVKVIEIGVWRGDFAQEILDRFHSVIDEYVMIEPAMKLTGQLAPELEKRLMEFPKNFPRVKFRYVNEISVDAANIFPDFYFDWIYIDALHTF